MLCGYEQEPNEILKGEIKGNVCIGTRDERVDWNGTPNIIRTIQL